MRLRMLRIAQRLPLILLLLSVTLLLVGCPKGSGGGY
jgi:hypothetical protein